MARIAPAVWAYGRLDDSGKWLTVIPRLGARGTFPTREEAQAEMARSGGMGKRWTVCQVIDTPIPSFAGGHDYPVLA